MLLKIYAMTWSFVGLVAIFTLVTGSFTPLIGVGFGFVCFGMIFMGMMNVLPATVGHDAPVITAGAKKESAKDEPVEMFPAGVMPIR